MKIFAIALAAGLAGLVPAVAQTAAAPAAPAVVAPAVVATPTTPAPATPSLTKDGKPRMKDVRAQCKAEVGTLKGEPRKQAMADCIIKQRPDKAAAVQCRMDPALKGMDKVARKTAVKACVDKTKG